jgi:hypothetical protein
MLQLLLTRTNQNKPELCFCGLSPGLMWGQLELGGRVWQSTAKTRDMAMCGGRGIS